MESTPGPRSPKTHTGWVLSGLYLENGDDGPEQGVEVLPVGQRVAVSLGGELAAEEVHPQDAARQSARAERGPAVRSSHTAGLTVPPDFSQATFY